MSRPATDVQKRTSFDQDTGIDARVRISRAAPMRRKSSIDLADVVFARGRECSTFTRGSMIVEATP
ncbi:hypothetical protein GCM10009819_06280 [Agromyces tropicus]|uniref:Uncharacterized protein n=1 Tax=Agromyces tropicus TaxID=555371 RepID=A0ABN2TZW4_9MICO